jgi:hypothetical protein
LVDHANWLKNYVVKMASSSVKCFFDCAADSNDLKISKIYSFVLGAAMKNNRFMFLAHLS